jgi:hypothetical protein
MVLVDCKPTKKGFKKFTYHKDASVIETDTVKAFVSEARESALKYATQEQKDESD